jgi:cytochrome b561
MLRHAVVIHLHKRRGVQPALIATHTRFAEGGNMSLKNSNTRYGTCTKFFHWVIFIGFVMQYFVAAIMVRIKESETFWGYTQGMLYDWHKSIGLIIFGIVICRYLWRRLANLPDWAPGLSTGEKAYLHWVERILYICMFVMPISGYVFVMAGDYGVMFFGKWPLPNPIGKVEWLSTIAEYTHITTAVVIVAAWLAHMGFVFKRHCIHRDRYLRRMLPFTHQG